MCYINQNHHTNDHLAEAPAVGNCSPPGAVICVDLWPQAHLASSAALMAVLLCRPPICSPQLRLIFPFTVEVEVPDSAFYLSPNEEEPKRVEACRNHILEWEHFKKKKQWKSGQDVIEVDQRFLTCHVICNLKLTLYWIYGQIWRKNQCRYRSNCCFPVIYLLLCVLV